MAINLRTLSPLLAAVLLFVVFEPYFVWGLMSNRIIMGAVNALLALLFFMNNTIRKNQPYFLFITFVMVIYCFTTGVSFLGFINIGFGLFLVFGKEDFSKKTFSIFVNIYSGIILMSSLVWIGVLFGVVSPIGSIDAQNDFKTYDYTLYPLTVQMNMWQAFRFCGPFDEPGVVGTTNIILLYIIGMKAKDWKTYALILSGALSLSLFFYAGVFLFLLIKNITKLRIIHLLLFALFAIAFYSLTKDNEIFSERIWERVEWNKDEGTIAGDNRMVGDANRIYNSKKWTLDWWFGDRNFKEHSSAFEGSSSYKVVILRCGMICFALYILFFLLYAHKYCNRQKFILFSVLFIITIFQRPWMFGIGYLFLFPYFARFDYNEEYIDKRRPLLKRSKGSEFSETKQPVKIL